MSQQTDILDIPAAGERERLKQRSNTKGLIRLAGHGCLIAITGGLVAYSGPLPLFAVALWLHGTVVVFLFAPLHETIHGTAFRSGWLNALVSRVAGSALLLPPLYFRSFHLAHHGHTQDPSLDPELRQGKPKTWSAYLLHLSGLPYWSERMRTIGRHALGEVSEPYIETTSRRRIVIEARKFLTLYTFLALFAFIGEGYGLIWYWLIPVLLGQPCLRLFLLAEHTGCPYGSDMLRNSRTIHSNALVRYLAWNMSYHAEHHHLVAVPFHALPALHSLVKDAVAVQARGYRHATREIAASLR